MKQFEIFCNPIIFHIKFCCGNRYKDVCIQKNERTWRMGSSTAINVKGESGGKVSINLGMLFLLQRDNAYYILPRLWTWSILLWRMLLKTPHCSSFPQAMHLESMLTSSFFSHLLSFWYFINPRITMLYSICLIMLFCTLILKNFFCLLFRMICMSRMKVHQKLALEGKTIRSVWQTTPKPFLW